MNLNSWFQKYHKERIHQEMGKIFLFLPIFTHFYMIENFYILQIINILHVTIVYILVPSYNINQDSLLKFYVSVYHHQPPPVLPWQLPKNFHHDSIQLICAQPKNEWNFICMSQNTSSSFRKTCSFQKWISFIKSIDI